jgi:ABC-type polysaccharide/polyol phosphate transport system ATPase subunit
MDGAARPREAWHALLRIAGFHVTGPADNNIQDTVTNRGQVLRGISLDIEQGSVVCLTGSQEAASVLLQLLDRVIHPTTGRIEIYGSVASLLTVGGNLDARRTAHENIRASRYFCDSPRHEAERYAGEVIEFAGLEGFEHVPLRTYSTGMTLRLSAALALCSRASIVLIDDVLAVGDIAFQQRCLDRVLALKEAGCTLVASFADDAFLRQVATRIITLADGVIVDDVTPGDWVGARHVSSAADVEWEVLPNLPEDDVVAFRDLSVIPVRDGEESHLDLVLTFDVKRAGPRCRPSVFLLRGRAVVFRTLFPRALTVESPCRLTYAVRLPTHDLSSGGYTIVISMISVLGGVTYSLKAQNAVALKVRRDHESALDAATPALVTALPWEIEMLAQGSS